MALDLSRTAKSLIRRLAATAESQFVQIETETGGTSNHDTGQWTPGTKSVRGVDAAVAEYAEPLIDGTNIKRGDKLVILAYDANLLINDVIIIDSVRYKVIDPDPLDPHGILQIYQAQVRLA